MCNNTYLYIPETEIDYYYDDENEEEWDIEFILNDLYEKIGYLKRRIEVLEGERSRVF